MCLHALDVLDRFVCGSEQAITIERGDDAREKEGLLELVAQLNPTDEDVSIPIIDHHLVNDLNCTGVHAWDVGSVYNDGMKGLNFLLFSGMCLDISESFDAHEERFDLFDIGEVERVFNAHDEYVREDGGLVLGDVLVLVRSSYVSEDGDVGIGGVFDDEEDADAETDEDAKFQPESNGEAEGDDQLREFLPRSNAEQEDQIVQFKETNRSDGNDGRHGTAGQIVEEGTHEEHGEEDDGRCDQAEDLRRGSERIRD